MISFACKFFMHHVALGGACHPDGHTESALKKDVPPRGTHTHFKTLLEETSSCFTSGRLLQEAPESHDRVPAHSSALADTLKVSSPFVGKLTFTQGACWATIGRKNIGTK